MIFRCFLFRDPVFLVKMFKTFVRPKLEYASVIWNPVYKMDIDALERVQRRFTKRIPGCANMSYSQRLQKLGLIPLELRRVHLDLIFTYKLLKGTYNVDHSQFFTLSHSRTRGHSLKLYPDRCKKELRKRFFSNRVVNIWNNLPKNWLEANTVTSFKKSLCTEEGNRHLWKYLKGGGLV